MKRRDIILEVQSMLRNYQITGGYQVAKSIVKLADEPEDTFHKIGANHAGAKRPMSQPEAKRIVDQARTRIELANAED